MDAKQQINAIVRLTANEKECLRRCLLPQTAKEMAVDLGISPHAVEKRLKMARAKLRVSSSLAAARLLAAEEQYQPLVPQPSDLPDPADPRKQEDTAAAPIGAAVGVPLLKGSLMLASLLALALTVQDAPVARPAPSTPSAGIPSEPTRKTDMTEASAFIRIGFVKKDLDHSGYLEPRELSALEPRDQYRDKTLPPAPPAGAADPAAERKWLAKMDTDRDGKVSEWEYVSYMLPWVLWQGVPADWHPS